jgi:gliding motility-associated-like protein
MNNMKKFKIGIILLFFVQTVFGQVSCVDTVYYPHSKMTAFNGFDLIEEGWGARKSISQTFDSNTGLIHGINAYVLLDTNGIVGDATPLDVYIKVTNVDGLNRPISTIDSTLVTITDIGTAQQTLMFQSPVAVSGRYALVVGFNPLTSIPNSDSLYYRTNDPGAIPADGGTEGLFAVEFGSGLGWINLFLQFAGQDDKDALLSPIFEKTIVASYITDADTVCAGGDIVFTNTGTLDTLSMYNRWNSLGTDPWSWNYNDGSGSYNHFDTTYTFLAGGTLNTKLYLTNYGYTTNCVDSAEKTVEVIGNVIASNDTSVCLGDSVNLSSTGSVTYSWDNGLGVGQSQMALSLNDTIYVVSGTGLFNCVSTDTVNVSINQLPNVIASVDTTVCAGDTVFLSVIGADTYLWDNGLGAGQFQDTISTIDTMYIVTGTDLLGCLGIDTVNVIVNSLPSVIASIDTAICLGDSANISASSAVGVYTWDNGLGVGQLHQVGPITQTTYIVSVTDLIGCSSEDTVVVTVNSLPSVIASIDTTICLGDSANISASSAVGVYTWNNGLGAGQLHQVGPITQTTYIVSVTDLIGCSDEDTVVVGVNSLPSVIASIDTNICIGDSVLISATSTQMSYSWDNGLGTGQQHTVSPSLLTNYIVSVTDLNNCIGTDTININVNSLPILVTNLDTNLCTVNSLTLFVSGADTYLWDNGLGAGDVHVLLTPMDTIYRVEGTDINGCVNNDSVVVTVAALNVVASNDTSICLGSFVTISASGATSYTWNNGLGFGSNQEVSPSESTTYIVTGDDNGCVGSDSVIISIENICFEIPNVFTPNGDGKNDVWNIGGLQLYPEIVVKVFNRWGDLVFESDAGYTESWDGTYNGTDSPSATYYYVIDLGGEEEGFMGNVNIIR